MPQTTKKHEQPFKPKDLKVSGSHSGKVQKTISLRQEVHHALAKKAWELNLWESDIVEYVICEFLGIEPTIPKPKSQVIKNLGEKRKYPNPSGFNILPVNEDEG
jgi:hypothetical protein